MRVRLLPASLLFFCALTPVRADDVKFFETKVQPILQEHCYKCHSHSSDKIKGGLVMDSRDALIEGGDSGAAVVPGDLEKSLMIEAVRYANDDLQMPPKGKKLADAEIAILEEWVKLGAPWPDTGAKKTSRPKGKITDEDRKWWAFQPVAAPAVPAIEDGGWGVNAVDGFILQRLQMEGLKPAPQAERSALIRRVYFDLVGIPPTPDEVKAFVSDASPDAYPKLVDRLLASPQYGERWARHWLDLVRYAESDGFRIDDFRPHAWRYRDYVVRAFNDDKPYDRFLAEQIAGDEIAPDDLEARVATGYLRHWLYEYNNRDVPAQWTNILNDITDVTADVFMGMGLQCARCHDHKFDPLLQKDYYRLQAFFAPVLPRDDLKLSTPEQERVYTEKYAAWEEATSSIRAKIAELEAPHRKKAADDAIAKFPPETQALIRKPAAERAPWEHQIAELAYRQVLYEYDRLVNKMRGADKDKVVALYKELSAFDNQKPAPLPQAFAVTDVGSVAPPVTIPKKAQLGEIAPGFLTILHESPATVTATKPGTTGRRKALAEWMTDPQNPLTTRVIVNRIWQYHFGRGLVGTSSDFGTLGDKPSHPELLDWMAHTFVKEGWSVKKMHRLLCLSATYQQATQSPIAEMARVKDPENKLLWRGTTRRLDAEQIRDAVLAVTGELDPKPVQASVDWTAGKRTIYTKVIRNTRDPLLEVFDAPEGFSSTSQRNVTTTPTQSLHMINSPWSLARSRAFATRLQREASSSDSEAMVGAAYQLAFGRDARPEEVASAGAFLEKQAGFVALNPPASKAAPFAADKIPFRDGRAALFVPGSSQDKLQTTATPSLPGDDFTAEAFVLLKTQHEDGQVRTIMSRWDGNRGHPGWTLGVTGKQSRYKPQTLVLLLSGDQPWSDKDPVEPVFSGLHIELGKPYFVAVSVDLDDVTEKGITFYAKDLSNDDEPMQISQVAHKTTSGVRAASPLTIAGRHTDPKHLFDGVIDDVRVSNIPLPQEQLLLTREGLNEHTVGYWKFEVDPGVYHDLSGKSGDLGAKVVEGTRPDPRFAALVDFCQVLLNSNEFLYVD